MKKNNKGFTLVELLAVIVIMGILMMVAIPSVTRTIENSRKDTFVDIAKSYANAARSMWTTDNFTCNGVVSSAVDDGDYYILINSKSGAKETLPTLVDQGGQSSWGNRDVNGYVRVNVSTTAGVDSNNDGTYEVEPRRVTKFYVALSDGTHGLVDDDTLTTDELKRGNVVMSLSQEQLKQIQLTVADGKLDCAKEANGELTCTAVTPIKNITGVCVDDQTTVAVTGNVEPPIATPLYFGKKYNVLQDETGTLILYSFVFYEDGHVDVSVNGEFVERTPAGIMTYADNKVYQEGEHILNISHDKKTLYLADGTNEFKLVDENVKDIYFGQNYSTIMTDAEGTYKYTYIGYEDGSAKLYVDGVLAQEWPTKTFIYHNGSIIKDGEVIITISSNRKELHFISMNKVFKLEN